jgi:hypothetical protein
MGTLVPDTPKQHNDLVDIVVEAAQYQREIILPDGTIQTQPDIDSEIIWMKTQIVANPRFGNYIKELKDFQALATLSETSMSKPRSDQFKKEVALEVISHLRAIDATSSISRLDKNNTQPTLVDKINSSKVPRYYSLKEDTKKSLMEGLFGKKNSGDPNEG